MLIFAGLVGECDDKPLLRKQFGRDRGARIHDGRIDQKAIFHAVKQRIAERGLTVFAAEGAVGIEQQTALRFAWVARSRRSLVEALEIIARRGREAELVADEIVEHGARIAADGTMRFVGNDQIEIGRRKKLLIFVIEQQRLHRRDHDFRALPLVAALLVNHRLKVRRQHLLKRLFSLFFEFEAIH